MVRDIVGPALQGQGQTEGYNWMMGKTKHVSSPTTLSGAGQNHAVSIVIVLFVFVMPQLF